ncbi:MAG: hypothetical protein GF417_12140, partial [Candidatus Latescibacteria bacterium]|nr:hypothetical protein [bacterium]MBD3425177.1 hypothetical protein [Candidatus Latescibacterota bacterium]
MNRKIQMFTVFVTLFLIAGYSSTSAYWATDGVPVAPILYQPAPSEPLITTDGAGGAIIAWLDNRDGNNHIYAQRINADGSIHAGWTPDGEPICRA